jgi:DNA-binding NtrC family response regulator
MMDEKLSILILDDEQRVQDEIEEFLVGRSFHVSKASTPSEAFKLLEENNIDIVILDIKLSEMDGLQVLARIKETHPEIEVIMISGHGDMNSVIEAMRLGAADFFPKPFRLVEIDHAISRTTRFIDLHTKLRKVKQQYTFLSRELQENIGHQIIGRSNTLKKIISLMDKVAGADPTTILITGDSGTGKELVARGIHYMSKRKDEFFHTVNCSAIPETLFESEFFGHKKGAFTGADHDKAGWFEIANHGTLLLDEIGDMPLGQQAKLLRVLDEKKVMKVGSHKEINIDVRVIAASNRNLEDLVEQHKFRLDLYHRISSFIIEIPPLKERKEDIPLLVDHFVKYYVDRLGKSIKYINPSISKNLQKYDFPGNIRELKNIVERAVILCEGRELTWQDFESGMPGKLEPEQIASKDTQVLDLEEMEKQMIIRALKKAGNNKAKSAELLNISWQSLDRRMKKFGI